MNGIELSRLFNEEYVEPMLCEKFSDVRGFIATGLAGQGSECYGFDDELSRDHDFGAGVCLWIPCRVEDKIGNALREAYALLPDIGCSKTVTERGSRIGVHTIESFYESLIGRPDAPADSMEWLRIPDKFYSQATNGEVFSDPLGEFSAVRDTLLAYYPDDVLKKNSPQIARAWRRQDSITTQEASPERTSERRISRARSLSDTRLLRFIS